MLWGSRMKELWKQSHTAQKRWVSNTDLHPCVWYSVWDMFNGGKASSETDVRQKYLKTWLLSAGRRSHATGRILRIQTLPVLKRWWRLEIGQKEKSLSIPKREISNKNSWAAQTLISIQKQETSQRKEFLSVLEELQSDTFVLWMSEVWRT